MIADRGLLFLAGFCWDLSLFLLSRNRGVLGLVYLILCIMPLCLATSYFMALDCLWGEFGCGCSMINCFSPFARALLAPSQLYFYCHSNATSVLAIFCSYFLCFSLLNCFLYHLEGMTTELLLLSHASCFFIFLVLLSQSFFYFLVEHLCLSSSAGYFSLLFSWHWFLCILWTFVFTEWCFMVSGCIGLALQPMASPRFLRVDLSLVFVVVGWYTTLVVYLPAQVCIRGWNLDFQPACLCCCLSGSDPTWILLGGCCSKDPLFLLHRCPFRISVASSFELWQPHSSVALFWTHDVLDFVPWLSEVIFPFSPSGLTTVWQSAFFQYCLFNFESVLSFWCLCMVRGCGMLLPQPKASLLYTFWVWIVFNLSLVIFKILKCVFNVSKDGLSWYTLAFFQVLSGPSFGPGTLHFTAQLMAPCSFIFSKPLCLIPHILVPQQLLFWRCLWLGNTVLWRFLLYLLTCIMNILVFATMNCIAPLWQCSLCKWFDYIAMYFSSPAYFFVQGSVTHFLSPCLYLYFSLLLVLSSLDPYSRFYFWIPFWQTIKGTASQSLLFSFRISLLLQYDLFGSMDLIYVYSYPFILK